MPMFHACTPIRGGLAYSVRAVASALMILVLVPSAHAAVLLGFTDEDGTPTQTTVVAGNSFAVKLNLTSTGGEQTTGLDYFLQDNTFTSGTPRFRISDRNVGASTYVDTFVADAVVEAQPGSLLDPSNVSDLGGSLANVNSPNGSGTFHVAAFTIAVNPSTPSGVYLISTFSSPNTGFTGPGPAFVDTPFNQHALFSVTVTAVPEPGSAAFLALGVVPTLWCRRATSVRRRRTALGAPGV